MDVKKIITPDNLVKVGVAFLGIASFALNSWKEKIDMKNLQAKVVDDVLANLKDQNK